MRGSRMYAALLAGALVTLPGSSPEAADQIVPLLSFRDVNVIVTVSAPPDWESVGDQDTSQEAGAFDFDADLPLALAGAEARGIAAQHSTIGESGLQAAGSLSSSAGSPLESAAGVIATNDYQVTFSVAGPVHYTLEGNLSATGEGRCAFSFAGEGIDQTFDVQDGSVPLDLSGELPAGQYLLFASLQADVNVNLTDTETRTAAGSFTIDFTVSPAVPNGLTSWGKVKSIFR